MTEHIGVPIKHHTCIREVSGSNLAQVSGCRWTFHALRQPYTTNVVVVLSSRSHALLSTSFMTILPYHLTLYNLCSWNSAAKYLKNQTV